MVEIALKTVPKLPQVAPSRTPQVRHVRLTPLQQCHIILHLDHQLLSQPCLHRLAARRTLRMTSHFQPMMVRRRQPDRWTSQSRSCS